MAKVPAETGGGLQSDLLEGFTNLNLVRQLGLMLGLAASVAIGFSVVLWSQGEDYQPLYSNLARMDSTQALQILDNSQIKYKVDQSSGALLVEAGKIHEARLKMADSGMTSDGAAGFELLDKEQPLGTSQFMENARYRRSFEGELARTIMSISSVRGARVHLALPRQTTFIRDQQKPSASVFVELFPGARLNNEQVRSIANLVASSIPEMPLENVTVVDQRGNLLSKTSAETEQAAESTRQLDYIRQMEDRTRLRVASILEPMLGNENFRAEVAADVDFTAIEQADEVFNPDLPAVRSEQTMQEQRGEASAGGIPGALSNQPPVDGAAPEQATAAAAPPAAGAAATAADGGRSRQQVVRNYELDRTVSYTKHQVGKLRRLTVAVAVNNKVTTDAEGKKTEITWTPEEIQRLTTLVRDAVGYDPARGDSINVINTAFLPSTAAEDAQIEELPIWQQPWVMNYVKQGLGGLFVIILVFAVLRPVMSSLTQVARETRQMEVHTTLGDMGGLGGEGGGQVSFGSGSGMMLPGPEEGQEQQITAVKGLIAEDPGRVAQVVRRWVNSGE
jgi:flagellar M-ring protein FliF